MFVATTLMMMLLPMASLCRRQCCRWEHNKVAMVMVWASETSETSETRGANDTGETRERDERDQ